MKVLRTPDSRFDGLSGYPFEPRYQEIDGPDGVRLRMHYLDEGPKDGQIVLCLHGQPSWSYLYRKMIPILTAAGHRVIAPDLVGFGRSDKPAAVEDYSYAAHVDWLRQWLVGLDLQGLTLMCQDWGGLIGLRVVAEEPDRFARLVIANTGLPDSRQVTPEVSALLDDAWPKVPVPSPAQVGERFAAGAPDAFLYWVKYASENPAFSARDVFGLLSGVDDAAVLDGYEAPFPTPDLLAGARAFPTLAPLMTRHAADRAANDAAWKVLERFEKPVLTAFSDGDPVTRGGAAPFQKRVPGAKGRVHPTIKGAGHFLQEDAPEALSQAIIGFMADA